MKGLCSLHCNLCVHATPVPNRQLLYALDHVLKAVTAMATRGICRALCVLQIKCMIGPAPFGSELFSLSFREARHRMPGPEAVYIGQKMPYRIYPLKRL